MFVNIECCFRPAWLHQLLTEWKNILKTAEETTSCHLFSYLVNAKMHFWPASLTETLTRFLFYLTRTKNWFRPSCSRAHCYTHSRSYHDIRAKLTCTLEKKSWYWPFWAWAARGSRCSCRKSRSCCSSWRSLGSPCMDGLYCTSLGVFLIKKKNKK